MSFTLEFPDSELRDVVAEPGVVRLRFSAATVRDAHGVRGWLSSVALTMTGARMAGDAALAFGRIKEGRLLHGGVAVVRLPLDAALAGELELGLHLANGATLSVRAADLALAVAPGAVFTEDLSC